MRSRRTALELVALGMAAAAVVFGVAMLVDPRTVEGWPAWLKPAKFAASTAIYSATLAWIFRYLPDWPRLTRHKSGSPLRALDGLNAKRHDRVAVLPVEMQIW